MKLLTSELCVEEKPCLALGGGFMEVAKQEFLFGIYQLDISFRNIAEDVVSRKSCLMALLFSICYVQATTFGMSV